MEAYHVEIDLHKEFSQVTAIDDEGNILGNKRLANEVDVLEEYFQQGAHPLKGSPFIMEATRSWYWMSTPCGADGIKACPGEFEEDKDNSRGHGEDG